MSFILFSDTGSEEAIELTWIKLLDIVWDGFALSFLSTNFNFQELKVFMFTFAF